MSDDLNINLQEQIKAIKTHKQGDKKLRTHPFSKPASPEAIRNKLGLSQAAFAALLNISVKTLQNWEQGQRQPRGPALALLRIIDQHPEVLLTSDPG